MFLKSKNSQMKVTFDFKNIEYFREFFKKSNQIDYSFFTDYPCEFCFLNLFKA